jgi:endoglucanase
MAGSPEEPKSVMDCLSVRQGQELADAGVAGAHGFVVNVSNYLTTTESVTYAKKVNTGLTSRGGAKPFVVDTSRDGNGAHRRVAQPGG